MHERGGGGGRAGRGERTAAAGGVRLGDEFIS